MTKTLPELFDEVCGKVPAFESGLSHHPGETIGGWHLDGDPITTHRAETIIIGAAVRMLATGPTQWIDHIEMHSGLATVRAHWKNGDKETTQIASSHAEALPLAVCLAALRTVGTPEDEITKALEER